jgi:tRNA-binding EMAP/Myf-like protein
MALLAQTERPGLFVHALVYHAIVAADADGVLEPGEIQLISAMAMVLGLSEGEVEGLFALYRDEKAFKTRKMATLFPNGHPWG